MSGEVLGSVADSSPHPDSPPRGERESERERPRGASGRIFPAGTPKTLACLILLMLLGGAFRFWGLEKTGPYFIDQGDYMLEARWFYEVTLNLRDALPRWLHEFPTDFPGEVKQIFSRSEGHPMIMGRPLHSLLAAVPMFFVGYEPYLGNFVSALFGVLSIPLVYFLYRTLYGRPGALMAAGLLAVLGIHVHYSRNSFPETDSTFFLLLSLVFYAKSRQEVPDRKNLGRLLLSGFFWGLAIAANDRWITSVAALWIMEVHLWLWERRVAFRQVLGRWISLHAAILIPLLVLELPYLVLRLGAAMQGKGMPFPGYSEILAKHFLIAHAMAAARFIKVLPMTGFRLEDLLILPDICIRFNGFLSAGLLTAGLLLLIHRRRFADLLLLFCFFVPVLHLHLQIYHCMRHYSFTFPLIALISARAIVELGSEQTTVRSGKGQGSGIGRFWRVLFFLAMIAGLGASLRAAVFPFGYPEASRFIADKGWKVLSTNDRVSQSYLGSSLCRPSPASREELVQCWQEGYRHLEVDFLPVIWRLLEEVGIQHERDSQRLAIVKEITGSTDPLATIPNPGSVLRHITFEVLFHYRDAFAVAEKIREAGGDSIRIYAIPDPMSPHPDPPQGGEGRREGAPRRGEATTSRGRACPARPDPVMGAASGAPA